MPERIQLINDISLLPDGVTIPLIVEAIKDSEKRSQFVVIETENGKYCIHRSKCEHLPMEDSPSNTIGSSAPPIPPAALAANKSFRNSRLGRILK